MPAQQDHQRRREQILRAMTELAVRDGLHAVSMRTVAAAAGVSLRLVQYYFGSKAALMRAGLERLEARGMQRWATRTPVGTGGSARDVLLALFAEALPVDAERRAFHLLWMAYAVLAMTDAGIPGRAFVEGPDRLQAHIATTLEQGVAAGQLRADLDVELEAVALLGLLHGLGTAVLVGQQRADTAMAVVASQLDRLAPVAGR